MVKTLSRALVQRFHDQHSVVSRPQLRSLGIDAREERRRVAAGEWVRTGRACIALAGVRPSPEAALMAVLLDAGRTSVASHQSAAWLWDLIPPPQCNSVSIPFGSSARVEGADLHRVKDWPSTMSHVRGIPCTNPMRSLVDLAAVRSGPGLDDAVDRALASRLVTVAGIDAEIRRLSRRGRRGTTEMRRALHRRGFIDGPPPSVLESRLLRLLRRSGIVPLGVEVVVGDDGRYRIDVLIHPSLAVEVDGYAYHYSPEAMRYDLLRRNRIRLDGIVLLVYTWPDVISDGRRVVAEIRRAAAQTGGHLGHRGDLGHHGDRGHLGDLGAFSL